MNRVAPYAGYMVVGNPEGEHCDEHGRRSTPLSRSSSGPGRMESDQGNGRSPSERVRVYCAVEPKTGTFTLDGGVLTGNCPFLLMPGSGFAGRRSWGWTL